MGSDVQTIEAYKNSMPRGASSALEGFRNKVNIMTRVLHALELIDVRLGQRRQLDAERRHLRVLWGHHEQSFG